MNTPNYTDLPLTKLEENKGQIEGLPANPRKVNKAKLDTLKESITTHPEMLKYRGLMVYPHQDKYIVIGGNMRLKALRTLKYKTAPCIILPQETTTAQLQDYTLLDNAQMGEWDLDTILSDWDADLFAHWGIDLPEIPNTENKRDEEIQIAKGTLAEDFIIAPTSILNTREGEWQRRKNAWKALTLSSHDGREDNLTYSETAQPPAFYQTKNELKKELNRTPTTEEIKTRMEENGLQIQPGTSIFDPVLCEVLYTWFNTPHGKILDPFAGGAVRGIVAATLNMPYIGNDLRTEQIESNKAILENFEIPIETPPIWTQGDSKDIISIVNETALKPPFDMIFSCPPYADLEVYSDDPRDISNMDYPQFINTYREIIHQSCSLLKDNRFAVFVVSEVRAKNGIYQGFVQDTIKAFQDAGLNYYNELILINNLASGAIRARGSMKNRKPVRTHQNIIVMHKPNERTPKETKKEATLEHTNIIVAYKGDRPNENIQSDYHELKAPFDPLQEFDIMES